jgi:hypothetical protein
VLALSEDLGFLGWGWEEALYSTKPTSIQQSLSVGQPLQVALKQALYEGQRKGAGGRQPQIVQGLLEMLTCSGDDCACCSNFYLNS